MEQRRRLAEQANARLKQPARAPNIVPTLSPLQEITGVQLNDDMAGTNTATNSFFIAPESVASNYNVAGSPLGGGIGGRQRASSTDLTSRSDTLGAKRKDEL